MHQPVATAADAASDAAAADTASAAAAVAAAVGPLSWLLCRGGSWRECRERGSSPSSRQP